MATTLHQGVLVTIIGESVLQDRLINLLNTLGVSGYTIIPTQGAGSHGKRMSDMAGYDTANYNTNIQITTLVSSEISSKLIEALIPFRADHALIAFRQKVEGLFD